MSEVKSRKEILEKLYEKFKEPFPPEALSEDKSRGFALTSVKAQYIVERLNDVLGITNWRLIGEFKDDKDEVLFFGDLLVDYSDHTGISDDKRVIPTVGQGSIKDKGPLADAYKSARTDALSKAASYLGIANDVFKGKVAVPKPGYASSLESKAPAVELKKPSSFQGKVAVKENKDF